MTRMLRRDLLPAGKWAYPSRTPGSFPLPVDRYCQRSGHPSVKPFSTAEKEEGERERGRPRERAGLKKGLIHDSFALLMIQSKTERGGEHRKILSSLFTLSYAEIFICVFSYVILSYQNACYGCENTENWTWSDIFLFLWWTKVSEAVCKRDWHNVRSYLFFNMHKFWMRISDSVCKYL